MGFPPKNNFQHTIYHQAIPIKTLESPNIENDNRKEKKLMEKYFKNINSQAPIDLQLHRDLILEKLKKRKQHEQFLYAQSQKNQTKKPKKNSRKNKNYSRISSVSFADSHTSTDEETLINHFKSPYNSHIGLSKSEHAQVIFPNYVNTHSFNNHAVLASSNSFIVPANNTQNIHNAKPRFFLTPTIPANNDKNHVNTSSHSAHFNVTASPGDDVRLQCAIPDLSGRMVRFDSSIVFFT